MQTVVSVTITTVATDVNKAQRYDQSEKCNTLKYRNQFFSEAFNCADVQ